MAKRPGRTLKLSISLDKDDVARLAERARRIAGGNLSAAVSDVIRVAQEWEGRVALAEWLGEGREEPSAEVRDALRAEWRRGRRRRRSSAARRGRGRLHAARPVLSLSKSPRGLGRPAA